LARHLGGPETNRALFDLMRRNDLIDDALADSLYAMAGLCNILVHGYQEADQNVVRDVLDNRLTDRLAYVSNVRRQLETDRPG